MASALVSPACADLRTGEGQASPAPQDSGPSPPRSSALGAGAVAGIVVGVIAGLVVAAGAYWLWTTKRSTSFGDQAGKAKPSSAIPQPVPGPQGLVEVEVEDEGRPARRPPMLPQLPRNTYATKANTNDNANTEDDKTRRCGMVEYALLVASFSKCYTSPTSTSTSTVT